MTQFESHQIKKFFLNKKKNNRKRFSFLSKFHLENFFNKTFWRLRGILCAQANGKIKKRKKKSGITHGGHFKYFKREFYSNDLNFVGAGFALAGSQQQKNYYF